MGKIALETIKLIKKAVKDNFFGESTIFKWHGNFKKSLSTELDTKPGPSESIVNDKNAKTLWTI